MKYRLTLLALAVSATLLTLNGCSREDTPTTGAPPVTGSAPQDKDADAFIARVNAEIKAMYPEVTSAQWLSSTYINEDSQLIAAKSNERYLAKLNDWVAQAKAFEGKPMSPATERAILLLKLSTSMPPPRDPKKLGELTEIATRMEGMYGAGKYCTAPADDATCRDIGALSKVLADGGDYDAQLEAWRGWHTISQPMRKDYVRFVELVNEGARDMGFADAGEMWRSGYDMSPAEIAAETDRLWGQVKPLYDQLHCYARGKLESEYGADKGSVRGMIPAHLTGNLWQQDWSNLGKLLQPYPEAADINIGKGLKDWDQRHQDETSAKAQKDIAKLQETEEDAAALASLATTRQAEATREASLLTAKRMTQRAENFYVSLGMPKLPESYWNRTQFIKPRDREVVCHASAWDMNMAGDVRTKMCIEPTEDEFTTIYHELGHVYYYLAYNNQPPLFQTGAHDGFHEAIGDTIVLSVMTPKYLESIDLLEGQQQSEESLINAQMRMALSKVAFLPFGLMIDRWRWGVFDGSIKPDNYNQAWWALKAKYQGVAPVDARGEDFFDPGAKYHVPGNTPYTRYFLSHILQFQFYKALCDAAGHKGPLYECNYYGNPEAGKRFWAMLGKGASQPWQKTMKELTGGEQMDGSAVLEYFAPLQAWLKTQNEGRSCGWQAEAPTKG